MSSKGADPVAPLRPGCEKATPWNLVGPNLRSPPGTDVHRARLGTLPVETSEAVYAALIGTPHTDRDVIRPGRHDSQKL